MATSEFKPFGLGSGSYVMTPAAWNALPVRASGFPPGILPKENINTALRQSSSIATMISNFMAALQPGNVLDDGNLVTLQAQFVAALQALIGTSAGAPAYWCLTNTASGAGSHVLNWQSPDVASAGLGVASGRVTVDKAGLYLLNADVSVGYLGGAGGANGSVQFRKNAAALYVPNNWQENNNTTEIGSVGVNALVPLAVNDIVDVFFTNNSNCQAFTGTGQFSGVKVG